MISVIDTIDTSHEDMIHDASLDYYGTQLATCSSDESVKIFDVRNKKQVLIADLREHQGPVWQVSWSHPMYGNLLASCGYDKKVIIWQETGGNWTKMDEYTNHESSVNSVCWAPHEYGLMLACGSSEGSISILTFQWNGTYESKKIREAHTIGVNSVSFAPGTGTDSLLNPNAQASQGDNKIVKRMVSGGCDSLVKIWKEENGNWVEEDKLECHSDWVRDVAWAPSVGLPREMIASCGQDCLVIIWRRDPGDTVWRPTTLHHFSDVVWHVSWSLTGNILAVSGGDNKVSLWKESVDGQWICLSDVNQGQGDLLSGGAVSDN